MDDKEAVTKRVLITGGFGYLGGRLAQALGGQSGAEVLLGSRREMEAPPWLPRAKTVVTYWSSRAHLEEICEGVDAIIHLAAMNGPDCAANPVAALESNAVATSVLLESALRREVKRFVYVSTAHVYGSALTGVVSEETCPDPLHPYSTSKRAGEDVLRGAHQRGAVEGVVVRLSNAFGAPASTDTDCWMLLANDLCRQAVTNKKMVLTSSGTQRRDFVPLADACGAIAHLLRVPRASLGKGLFNMGGEWSPTVWEMACFVQQRCEAVLGFQPELVRVSPKTGESSAELDYQLEAIRETGFRPQAERTREVDQLIEFCRASFT